MALRSVRDLDVKGKRVLLRDDLNVPLKNGAVGDDTRITGALPTIQYLRDAGAKVILCSHLGRPDGKANPDLSLKPVGAKLAERLGTPVAFASDCVGAPARDAVDALQPGGILLLENLRFHAEEEKNNPSFARALASLADLYVNDAFGAAHRAHASTEGVAHLLPSAAGLLMLTELDFLEKVTKDVAHPYVCVIGGSKVTDKVRVLLSLIDVVDAIVVGGGMANTFLAAKGIDVGRSLRDPDLEAAYSVLARAHEKNVAVHLPVDGMAAPTFHDDDRAAVTDLSDVGDRMILDIGPRTEKLYAEALEGAKTIIFNGPMGVYEKTAYQSGTRAVCAAIAAQTKAGAISVVGGGDAAAAARILGFAESFSHVSTGGGAMLEYLEGETLPGVAALPTAVAAR